MNLNSNLYLQIRMTYLLHTYFVIWKFFVLIAKFTGVFSTFSANDCKNGINFICWQVHAYAFRLNFPLVLGLCVRKVLVMMKVLEEFRTECVNCDISTVWKWFKKTYSIFVRFQQMRLKRNPGRWILKTPQEKQCKSKVLNTVSSYFFFEKNNNITSKFISATNLVICNKNKKGPYYYNFLPVRSTAYGQRAENMAYL